MRTVYTRVGQTAFAATMSAMRTWLDHHGHAEVRFETATDETGILISLEFPADDVAYAFERRFGNTPPSTDVITAA
jgi:hypothetical protein